MRGEYLVFKVFNPLGSADHRYTPLQAKTARMVLTCYPFMTARGASPEWGQLS